MRVPEGRERVVLLTVVAVCGVVVLVVGRESVYMPTAARTGRARVACVPCCADVSFMGWPVAAAF